MTLSFFGPSTVTELVLLVLAYLLSAVIGIERQRKLKSAGLRTHTLVGLGSAVFTLVSAYGFADVGAPDAAMDPSRIAAQIVSGVGFLGAGVIFVRRNVVNGLTTAASIWVTAAVGMACGAGQPTLAIVATGLHLVTVGFLTLLGRRLRPAPRSTVLVVRYRPGGGKLRQVLSLTGESGHPATLVGNGGIRELSEEGIREVAIRLQAPVDDVSPLISALQKVAGVVSVVTGPPDEDDD